MDDIYPVLRFALPFTDWQKLPQNSAYKYEYFDDHALLSPRPKTFRAVRDLRQPLDAPPADVRPLPVADIPRLVPLFNAAFGRVQPFASLPHDEALAAARKCLSRTADGSDGPLIRDACFQVFDRHCQGACGALLMTLVPAEALDDPFVWKWPEPPPPDALERGLGCPHLTWVFVGPLMARHGLGRSLLAAALPVLRGYGYRTLASTFLLGNDSSTLWHWRAGFTLQPKQGYH